MFEFLMALAILALTIQNADMYRKINKHEEHLRNVLIYLHEKQNSNREFLETCRKFREMMDSENNH